MNKPLLLTFITALLFSALGVFVTLRLALRFNIIDTPNARSLHVSPTPRGGGLGILLGAGIAAAVGAITGVKLPSWELWAGLGLMMAVGLWDDISGGIHFSIRLTAHLGAALLVVAFLGDLSTFPLPEPLNISLNGIGAIFALIWIVVVINFYNFMDGIDGLAGTQALITGVALAIATSGETAWLGSAMAGACLGFLFFNWHPAKIFLGDVGSYSLGYMLAAAPFLQGSGNSSQLTMLIGLSLWLFLADASWVLIRRIISRERVWEPHKSHLYQRLIDTGLSHSRVTTSIGIGSAVISCFGVAAYRTNSSYLWWVAFVVAMLVFLIEFAYTRIREGEAVRT